MSQVDFKDMADHALNETRGEKLSLGLVMGQLLLYPSKEPEDVLLRVDTDVKQLAFQALYFLLYKLS